MGSLLDLAFTPSVVDVLDLPVLPEESSHDQVKLIAYNRALLRYFLATTEAGTYIPASLLGFDEDTPINELETIGAELRALIGQCGCEAI